MTDIDVQATKHAPLYQLLYQLLAIICIIIAYQDNHEIVPFDYL